MKGTKRPPENQGGGVRRNLMTFERKTDYKGNEANMMDDTYLF